jgi:hypothetical protein
VDRRLIVHKFWGNFGSLPDFCNVITFVSIQDERKCDNRKQWLNRCVRWTSGHLGRWMRHSFGMPSIPQAFLSLRKFTSFVRHNVFLVQGDCRTRLKAKVGLHLPLAVHGFCRTEHAVWTDFPVTNAMAFRNGSRTWEIFRISCGIYERTSSAPVGELSGSELLFSGVLFTKCIKRTHYWKVVSVRPSPCFVFEITQRIQTKFLIRGLYHTLLVDFILVFIGPI